MTRIPNPFIFWALSSTIHCFCFKLLGKEKSTDFHKEHAHLRTFAGCVGAAVILPLHDNCFIIWHLCLHIGYFPNQSCNLKLFCKYCIHIIITIKLLCKAVICQFVCQRYFLKIFNLTNSYLLKFLLLRFSNYECGLFSP